LTKDIRRDVLVQSPASIFRVVSLAKLYEEKYASMPPSPPSNSIPRYSLVLSSCSAPSIGKQSLVIATLPPLLLTPSTPLVCNANVKQISLAKTQLRREKGLCYFYDEKFTFNHRSPHR